jgi:selenocysteine lyase/cysteine desulfurase
VIQHRLFEEFRIEAPVRHWNGQPLIRVSVAPYTTCEDLQHLQAALETMFSGGDVAFV